MGCDIHLKIQANTNGSWQTVEPPSNLDLDDFNRKYKYWWSDRNYDAFGILADVRNGRGFAGCHTGDAFIPVVAERRGIPDDFVGDRDDLGDHSFHWLTLRELVDYPHWDRTRSSSGVVTSAFYVSEIKGKPARINGGPREYCGGVMGNGIRTLTEVEYLALGDAAPVDAKTYVHIEWPESYAYSSGTLYTKLIPSLRKWADDLSIPYERVRLVFGFDS